MVPIELLDAETLDACVKLYVKRQKSLGEGPGAVLYDYCQSVGIAKLASVRILDTLSEPDVHVWIVKHAWDQFHWVQNWYVPTVPIQVEIVRDTDVAVQNWLLTPRNQLTNSVCHQLVYSIENARRQMFWHRQCLYLLGAIHQPVIHNILTDSCSRSARRLVHEQPDRAVVAQRHRLLYQLAGHLPAIDPTLLVPGMFG